jgi:hypothetical protein
VLTEWEQYRVGGDDLKMPPPTLFLTMLQLALKRPINGASDQSSRKKAAPFWMKHREALQEKDPIKRDRLVKEIDAAEEAHEEQNRQAIQQFIQNVGREPKYKTHRASQSRRSKASGARLKYYRWIRRSEMDIYDLMELTNLTRPTLGKFLSSCNSRRLGKSPKSRRIYGWSVCEQVLVRWLTNPRWSGSEQNREQHVKEILFLAKRHSLESFALFRNILSGVIADLSNKSKEFQNWLNTLKTIEVRP